MKTQNAFRQRLRIGQIGEGYIANWFKRQGYIVLPIYEKEIHTGKGPQIFFADGQLIAPDVLVFRQDSDKVFWIEAKTKEAFTWYRIGNVWNTGIDLCHYKDYLEIDAWTPWPIWLLFLQQAGEAKDTPLGKQSPTGLFGHRLDYLKDHECHRSNKWGDSGMVYWTDKTLLKLASLEEIMMGYEKYLALKQEAQP